MSAAKLFLLGPPYVEGEGAPVELDTRKALALLAYLALTGQRHSRDTLAALLWPEYNHSRARAALRRTLSALSAARQEGWLVVERESVGLDDSRVWVDVDRFRRLLEECRSHGHPERQICQSCLPLLAEAVALYRDDFLSGFGLRDSLAFDDWQYLQAEDLRRELAAALERLARGYGAMGEWEAAIGYTRRWLTLEPLHEPAHHMLMQLYALSGRRSLALGQYQECLRSLKSELGVSPLEETTALYREIKRGHLPPQPTFHEGSTAETETSPAASAPEVSGVPLVGRGGEWEALIRAYRAAERGSQLAVVEGEGGLGKTRLAEEVTSRLAEKGATVIAARCYIGEASLAYRPFVEALSTAVWSEGSRALLEGVSERALGEVARLLPGLFSLFPDLPEPSSPETPGAKSRFFEGVGEVLAALCEGERPGVVFVDDLHGADEASLELLAYLLRRGRRSGRRLLFLITWRGDQVPPGHHLRRLVVEARREGAATMIKPGRLGPEAVEELVSSLAVSSDEISRWIYEETEGLPLFVSEYLKVAQSGGLPEELPESVRELLLERLAPISETGWQLLTAAAAIGRSFDFDTAREASGRSEEEAIAALEELLSRGLVEETGEGAPHPSYDFSHDKLRALVYEKTSLARRRLLHRRVAETLAGRYRREPGVISGKIAYHYRMAGQSEEAAEYSKVAGEYARALYANAEALSHFQEALALGHPQAAALHEDIGDLHTLLGNYGMALASYEAASGDPSRLAVLEHKLGLVYQRRSEWELSEGHYASALEALREQEPDGPRARLYADYGLAVHYQGREEEAEGLARRSLELARDCGDGSAESHSRNILGILAVERGDLGQARRHLEHSLRLAEELDDLDTRVAALNNLARSHGAAGELGEAIGRTEAALGLCLSLGDRHREAALRNNLADLLHAAGREEEAMVQLKEAVAIFAEIGEEGRLEPGLWKLVEW